MNAPERMLRIPGPAGHRDWKTNEVAVLRDVYPVHGAAAAVEALPERSLAAIYRKARELGLSAPRVPRYWSEKKWSTTDAIDAEIRRVYEAGVGRGEVNELARRLMRPRYWVVRRATDLGLKAPRFKEPPWTPKEDELLEELIARGNRLPVVSRKMRDAGFQRTETACAVRLKRRGISRRGDGTEEWSATALAKLMGVDATTVTKRWIRMEGLPAKRRGTERVAAQGGDEFVISREGLRRWLKDHAQCVDLRKVDRFFFWSVVF